MKHVHQSKAAEIQVRTPDAFSRMGVAMGNMLAAAPKSLATNTVDGEKECHGKRKAAKKVA